MVSVQQTLELSSSPHTGGESFQNPLPLQPEDVELPQAPPVFPCLETLSIIQKQDISPSATFPVSGDTTIPPVTPEVPQQFLRDPQESITPERSNGGGGVVVVSMPQIAAPSQPQPQQSQVSLFPEEGVALERAVRELQAGGSATLQQVLEAAVAQQQLNSVLYSPTPSAESLQQHVQENMNSLRLGTTDSSLSTQQQMQLQQQQHQMHQFQQHQQLQQHLEQQQQVLGTMQIQQQLILQPQDQLQQQQQQQIIENMQQQQLQQNQQQQVLSNIQLQEQQQQNQLLNNLQHHQLQQQQNQALSNLQQQQQLQEQVLENLQQQLQAELLQPQMHSSSQQQPVSLLQQAGELLTIQTSFPTQPPSHTSPPQQLFQSPRSLAESQGSQGSQQQVQAALLQNTLTVLASGSLASEQQAAGSTLYLSPNPQPQQQQQQLAFISSIETSSEAQPVAIFQNQPQAQLSQMQQQSTPMEQQQSPQQTSQQPQLPMGQQSTLFQSIPNHLQVANPGSQSQLPQPQQTGLLLCTAELSPQAIPQAILFSTQTQGPSPAGGINVGIAQPEPAEPMSFQDQSSSHNNPASTENQQQNLFQDQQPMQVGPASSSIPNSQPVELFLPQTSLTSLQNNIDSQEMNSQPAAPGTTIFVVQGGVGVVASPGQQPSDQLFQTSVGGNVAPQGQANLFVFSIQNGKTNCLPGVLRGRPACLPSAPACLFGLCFPPRFSPAAEFLRASTASSEPAPELQPHAASVGPVHVSSCLPSAGHHAQQTTDQPSGPDAVQFRERHADQPAERGPGQHAASSAGWLTGLH